MTAPATATTATTTLDVRGVTVRFGGVLAVDDVTFTARTGEVLGVMGPNGAGQDDAVQRDQRRAAPHGG